MFERVRADIRCVLDQETGSVNKLGQLLFNAGLHTVLLYRLTRWLHLHHLELLALPVGYLSFALTGAHISRRAVIGKALFLPHPNGVVIGATTVIGDHCCLIGGNVIGQLYGQGDRPVIGNYFFGGAGAKILGKIKIGDRVRVGPNSVVIRSLPDNTTALGIPARIVFRRGGAAPTAPRRAPSHDEVTQRVRAVLKDCLRLGDPPDAIGEATPLVGKEMSPDSIDMLRLVCAIEEEFQIDIDESEETLSHFRTVGSLTAFIEKRSGV